MGNGGSFFKWHCGTCDKTLAAPDLEALRAEVLDHIREVRQRAAEPRCGHCGQPIDETKSSLEHHTTFWSDSQRTGDEQPVCGIKRFVEKPIKPKHAT